MDEVSARDLRDRCDSLCFDWHAANFGEFKAASSAEILLMVEATSAMETQVDMALHRWVATARRSGQSWSDIARPLGTSKQGAAKRFGRTPPTEAEPHQPGTYAREATTLNEEAVLAIEGRRGGEAVHQADGQWRFRKTEGAWRYRRVVSFGAQPPARIDDEGLQWFASAWPFHYYKGAV